MTFPLLTRLMALMSVICPGSSAVILHTFPDHHLNDTDIATTTVVVKKCDCRLLCMADETCRAVTATGDGERVTCAFTDIPQPGMTSAATGAITYVKSVPCQAPYELVDGVGCIWVSNFPANFTTALNSCPKNAGVTRLASPATDPIYWRLTKYIINKGSPVSNLWCGVTKVGSEWVWLDGHTMPITVGERLWKGGEPKGGNPCVSMRYHPLTGGFYHFVDHACNAYSFKFVCEMR